ncbi:hypothetical protein AB0K43_08150 [Kitasatospora sp. NPDC049258]|uniref:hypothetical protein n=1 Tax=Kitasatospora sp. NPDC049258 TaxID=3155394 RepID=UPI003426DC49
MDGIKVDPGELRASAGVARALGVELDGPVGVALGASTAGAGRLAGWAVARGLGRLADGWAAPLAALRGRLADTAANLESNADSHVRTDQAVADLWKAPVAR